MLLLYWEPAEPLSRCVISGQIFRVGIEIGFDAATASLIAAQTVKGAAELLLKKTNPSGTGNR